MIIVVDYFPKPAVFVTEVGRCQFCGDSFEVGQGRGRGRRLNAKFCSEEHKVRFHSLARSKAGV